MRQRHRAGRGRLSGPAVAGDWLPVLDNLDLALAHADADPAVIIDGVRAVRDQAAGVLASGWDSRAAKTSGLSFDPARHEAIGSRQGPTLRPGPSSRSCGPAYGEGEHQLRPALVVVAKAD